MINRDHGYVHRISDFELIDGVVDALRRAADKGYKLIIVTNQSGIGRGYFSQAEYSVLEEYIKDLFASAGMPVAIYHCPHGPEEGCDCRKPAPGMILRAARDYDIDLARSILIGDKQSDIDAGLAAGVGRVELMVAERDLESVLSDLPLANPS